jgi:hypothetical protein
MIDSSIADKVQTISKNVDEINQLMSELYENNVEIRIAYKDASKGDPPRIDLWRAIEHVDYLKTEGQDTHEQSTIQPK